MCVCAGGVSMHLEGKITLACDALYPLDVHRMMTNTEDGNVVGWCVNVCVCRGRVSLEQGVGITPASPGTIEKWLRKRGAPP